MPRIRSRPPASRPRRLTMAHSRLWDGVWSVSGLHRKPESFDRSVDIVGATRQTVAHRQAPNVPALDSPSLNTTRARDRFGIGLPGSLSWDQAPRLPWFGLDGPGWPWHGRSDPLLAVEGRLVLHRLGSFATSSFRRRELPEL